MFNPRVNRTIHSLIRSISTRPRRTQVPVDSLSIPLSPPYSIKSYIPSPTPLSRSTLLKLHKLTALVPPKTEEEWLELEGLGGLIAIIEGVRLVDTSFIPKGVDGRIRERAETIISSSGDDTYTVGISKRAGSAGSGGGKRKKIVEKLLAVEGSELLKLAQVTDGRYFIVRTPEGIRGKKRSSGVVHEEEEE